MYRFAKLFSAGFLFACATPALAGIVGKATGLKELPANLVAAAAAAQIDSNCVTVPHYAALDAVPPNVTALTLYLADCPSMDGRAPYLYVTLYMALSDGEISSMNAKLYNRKAASAAPTFDCLPGSTSENMWAACTTAFGTTNKFGKNPTDHGIYVSRDSTYHLSIGEIY